MDCRTVFGRKLIIIVVFGFRDLSENQMKPQWESPPSPASLPSTSKGPELTLLFPSQARCWAWSPTLPIGSLPNRIEKASDMPVGISQDGNQAQGLLYLLGRVSSQKERKNGQEKWWKVRASKDKTGGRRRSRRVRGWGRLREACLPETRAMKCALRAAQGDEVVRSGTNTSKEKFSTSWRGRREERQRGGKKKSQRQVRKENCKQARFTQHICIWYDPWDGGKWCLQFQGNYIQRSHSLLPLPRCCLQHQLHGSTLDLEEWWGRNSGASGSLGRGLKKKGYFQETPEEGAAVCQESTPISTSLPAHCQTAYWYLFVSCFFDSTTYTHSIAGIHN